MQWNCNWKSLSCVFVGTLRYYCTSNARVLNNQRAYSFNRWSRSAARCSEKASGEKEFRVSGPICYAAGLQKTVILYRNPDSPQFVMYVWPSPAQPGFFLSFTANTSATEAKTTKIYENEINYGKKKESNNRTRYNFFPNYSTMASFQSVGLPKRNEERV